jgi:hypothetical protein
MGIGINVLQTVVSGVCDSLASCSNVFTIFTNGYACQEKILSIGLQAQAGSSMYLSTYLPNFTLKKKQP